MAFLFLFSSGLAQVKKEVEPNDNREQAQEIRVGESVEAGVQKDYDEDWFKLVVDKSGKNYLKVEVSAIPEVDTYFSIYDSNNQRLAEINDTSKNEPESLTHFPVEPGFYFIRVYCSGKATPEKYNLITKITGPWKEGWELEPNNSRERANELKIGQSTHGYFQQKNDDDWFRLINDKPGKILVQIDLSAVPGVDSEFDVYNEKGSRIWSVDDTDVDGAESVFNLALDEGVYYVEVSAREINIKDAYTLSTKIFGPWQEGLEAEPNNSRETATEIRLGQSVQGYYQAKGDKDYFRLIVDKPGKNLIQVDLSGVPGTDGRVEIYDKEGKRLWDANDGDKGEPESIPYFVVSQGVYFIHVRGNQKNIASPYTLSTRMLGPWQEGMEAEPNDEIKRANEIKLNVPFSGRVNQGGDEDYYVLTVPPPGVDIVVMTVSAVPGVRFSFELLDPKEKSLGYSWFGQDGQGEEMVKMKFAPGTYYLKVKVRGGENIGAEYTLYVGKPQRPPATEEEVQKALIKALDYLASTQQKDGAWEDYEQAYAGLSIMAFLGSQCTGKDYSSSIQKALGFLKSKFMPRSKYPEGSEDGDKYGGTLGTDNMYQHAIATLGLVEALADLNDESLEAIAREAIELIIRSQNTEHKPKTLRGPIKSDSQYYGGWRYHPDSTDSDISLTGWQILALKAAANAGFVIPDYVFPAAARFVRSLQGKEDGSFRYDSPGEMGNSCARAGMGALSLQLSGYPKDPMVPPAIRFMQNHPPRWNIEEPGDGYPFYYWYYGTRVMYLAGGEDWRIWKDWMCRFLVDHQNPDGSWDGAESEENYDIYRVALAALMLEFCCGHVPIYMSPVKRLGSGALKVDFEKGAEKEAAQNVEVILDASNSMWGQIGGEAKITIARKVLAQIINGLPQTMNVGLRVYGHRYALNDMRACTDTELLAPIGPLDKARLIETINKIQLKGKTPLVYSVLEAIKDFETIPNGSIILVTDGIESCGGDIKSIGPAVKNSGLELRVHIVGFDIKEKEARAELEAIAKSTEGRYLDAQDAAGLLSALEQTLKVEYAVLNEKGEEVGRGLVGGDEIKLKEGTYTLRILLAPQPLETKVVIQPGRRQTCILKKEAGAWKLTL
ncbi:MAG: prenyltransferase/squalene oxidase repeat-containing protein [Clostridiales bacterium]|nr:prenyltransferase/squalene oxidase repeat-containing protein [Clostridiales bacterium]